MSIVSIVTDNLNKFCELPSLDISVTLSLVLGRCWSKAIVNWLSCTTCIELHELCKSLPFLYWCFSINLKFWIQ